MYQKPGFIRVDVDIADNFATYCQRREYDGPDENWFDVADPDPTAPKCHDYSQANPLAHKFFNDPVYQSTLELMYGNCIIRAEVYTI